MASASASNDPSSDSPATRLARLLRAKACIIYHENLPDPEYPKVRCSIYGAPKTNELFVRISNGREEFVAVTSSLLIWPPMSDRIFGLDTADHNVAFGLADELWAKHRAILTKAGNGG